MKPFVQYYSQLALEMPTDNLDKLAFESGDTF